MLLKISDPGYHKRQLVETKFYVLKRKFGGYLKARRFLMQMNEIANKNTCQYPSQVLTIFHRDGFIQSKNSLKKISG
jgi:hypothetical protein